jgi:hypothetical protein
MLAIRVAKPPMPLVRYGLKNVPTHIEIIAELPACLAGAVTNRGPVSNPRAQWPNPAVSRLSTHAGEGNDRVSTNGTKGRFSACPCRIFKPERTDGEAHPRSARRARVLRSERRAEWVRPSSAIDAYDSCCNILGKS